MTEQITDIGLYIQAHEGLIHELYLYFILFDEAISQLPIKGKYYDISDANVAICEEIEKNIKKVSKYIKQKIEQWVDERYTNENINTIKQKYEGVKNWNKQFLKLYIYKDFVLNNYDSIFEYDKKFYFDEICKYLQILTSNIKDGNELFDADLRIIKTFIITINRITHYDYFTSHRLIKFLNNIILHSFGCKNSDDDHLPIFETTGHIANCNNNLFSHVIISLDKTGDFDESANDIFDDYKYKDRYWFFMLIIYLCYAYVINDTGTSTLLYILEPSEHVNAPVGRNISFNFIRQNEEIFKNTIWLGSDADDNISPENLNMFIGKIKTFNTNNILLLNNYQNMKINVGIKRYAAWSYMFSPIVHDRISYRCAPMNKEDLDFFNRLINSVNDEDIKHLNNGRDTGIYEYQTSQGDYEKYDIFRNDNIIEYMNKHHQEESNGIRAPLQDSATSGTSKHFYIKYTDDARSYNGEYVTDTFKKGEGHDERKRYCYGLNIKTPIENLKNKKVFNPSTEQDNSTKLSNDIIKQKFGNENYYGDVYLIEYKAHILDNGGNYNEIRHIMFQNGKIPTYEDLNKIGFISTIRPEGYNAEIFDIDILHQAIDGVTPYRDIVNTWNEYITDIFNKTIIPIEGPVPMRDDGVPGQSSRSVINADGNSKYFPRFFGGNNLITKIIYCLIRVLEFIIILIIIICCIRCIKQNILNVC